MPLNTYDPRAVVVTWNGITLHGYVDGTFVTTDRDEDAFSKKTGNDGETTRTLNANRGGSVTVVLMQGSAANDLLSAQAAQDELLGDAVGPIQVEDLRGSTLEHAQNAWIKKTPQSQFAKESGDREWVFDCDYLRRNIGGLL